MTSALPNAAASRAGEAGAISPARAKSSEHSSSVSQPRARACGSTPSSASATGSIGACTGGSTKPGRASAIICQASALWPI
ncbi:hypothetical protein AL037_14215 [Salipiger aestuarii]|nr:hypothetical protein AL037_14215 [Salipiger aestuarii]